MGFENNGETKRTCFSLRKIRIKGWRRTPLLASQPNIRRFFSADKPGGGQNWAVKKEFGQYSHILIFLCLYFFDQ
jgi:hypothetical protein